MAAVSLAASAHGQHVEALPVLLDSDMSEARRVYLEATEALARKIGAQDQSDA